MKTIRRLCVILGDQLSESISALKEADKQQDAILMMEVKDETEYVPHHPQKIIFILSAMRHFAALLKSQGWTVHYIKLEDKNSKPSFEKTLQHFLKSHQVDSIHITEPGEYRVLENIQQWEKKFSIPVMLHEDTRFFCGIDAFKQWAKGKKQLRMEMFYRHMRSQTGFLMDAEGQPEGGKWNYDKDNRKPFKDEIDIPSCLQFKTSAITKEVIALVQSRFKTHFGDPEPFHYAVTREDAIQALKEFIEQRLMHFGDYQDAMVVGEYTLFHSILSPYLNVGLLLPNEVCKAAIRAYRQGKAPLNAVEGFVRQILGWREFIRGVYWTHMPEYENLNHLSESADLPDFYWTADTDMLCMKQAIEQTKVIAHSHHIQRLMVTGNFALLYGVEPKQICEWYLAVYIDAFDWVELPNTLGMVMHADGGVVGSKPYAASGNYINRMSNFCKSCRYDVKKRIGDDACPFNFLYWDFLLRQEKRFKNNPRMALVYKHVEKLSEADKKAIRQQAKQFRQQS